MPQAMCSSTRGVFIDLKVGEGVTLLTADNGARIVVTIEEKSGRRSRIRIQASENVKIEAKKLA